MKYSQQEIIQYVQEEDVKFIRLAFCDVFGKQKNISIMPVKVGEVNTIAVKVDHKTPSSRWYSGSGIYRSVYLTTTDKVHVDLKDRKSVV